MAKNIFKDNPLIKEVHFKPGEKIIKENFTDTKLFILRKGKVEVTKEGIRLTTIEDKGTYIGEISSILGIPRNATVTAVSDVSLYLVEKVSDFLKQNPEAALDLGRVLAGRIVDMNERFVEIKKNFDEITQTLIKDVEEDTGQLNSIQASLKEIEKSLL